MTKMIVEVQKRSSGAEIGCKIEQVECAGKYMNILSKFGTETERKDAAQPALF